ncbi:kinase [Micromonospora sp. WMMD710]|uniref:kinase n=1 Tax=Micromonospora sp. WMMD710 TaxID=3016085 RepID=UPI0024172531|nr:kinase [Micromonospora sp. WMMD710]MDG4760433.1 kinase [Micromonospora sp. WMMD710]
MTTPAIVLYGPPASGKDTITAALHQLDPRYVGFGKIKLAAEHGDTTRYRLASALELQQLRADGLVVYENDRYGNRYVVDRPGLDAAFAAGQIPVVHMGQVVGVRALRAYEVDWLPVLLWCSRDTTFTRARLRGSVDVDARLTVWDETLQDLDTAAPDDFALRIHTDHHQPTEAALLIDAALRRRTGRMVE